MGRPREHDEHTRAGCWRLPSGSSPTAARLRLGSSRRQRCGHEHARRLQRVRLEGRPPCGGTRTRRVRIPLRGDRQARGDRRPGVGSSRRRSRRVPRTRPRAPRALPHRVPADRPGPRCRPELTATRQKAWNQLVAKVGRLEAAGLLGNVRSGEGRIHRDDGGPRERRARGAVLRCSRRAARSRLRHDARSRRSVGSPPGLRRTRTTEGRLPPALRVSRCGRDLEVHAAAGHARGHGRLLLRHLGHDGLGRRMFFAIEAAFCSAERVTMVGSMIPDVTRFSISPVSTFRPSPFWPCDLVDDDGALEARVVRELPEGLLDRAEDDLRAGLPRPRACRGPSSPWHSKLRSGVRRRRPTRCPPRGRPSLERVLDAVLLLDSTSVAAPTLTTATPLGLLREALWSFSRSKSESVFDLLLQRLDVALDRVGLAGAVDDRRRVLVDDDLAGLAEPRELRGRA